MILFVSSLQLMNRKPKLRTPSQNNSTDHDRNVNSYSNDARLTTTTRSTGIEPEVCNGEIILDNVEMYYPARPQRRILNGLSLRVPAGKIAALVGQSGGGKSRYVPNISI